jgi:tetratricopeptide (TPR) repeat protein
MTFLSQIFKLRERLSCGGARFRIPVHPAWGASLVLLAQSQTAWALSPQQVYAVAAKSVVALEVVNQDGRAVALFSATQIAPERFVTVCDALDGAHALRLALAEAGHSATPANPGDGAVRHIDVQLSARDRERNLCFVDVVQRAAASPNVAQPITLQLVSPPTGSRVYAVSNALGFGTGISEGVVSGVRTFPMGQLIQFTAPISPGSEGGALVDDQGRLVGILDYKRRDGQNVNFAASAAWLQDVVPRAAAAAEQLKRYDAARALLKAEQWGELAALADQWLQLQPQQADALRFAIAAAKGQKNVEAELRGWQALHKALPEEAHASLGLGLALLSAGKAPEALALAKQLVAEHQEDAKAYLLLARAQQASGDAKGAAASYRQAASLDAWQMEAYQGLADLAQAQGDTATAISIWSRLSGLYPEALGLRTRLVQSYLAAGKPKQAYVELENLPAQHRDSPQAWYWRGATLSDLGLPSAAAAAFNKSLDLKFEPADLAWGGIGSAMMEMLRYPEAIAAFSKANQLTPQNRRWQYLYGVALKDGGWAVESLALAEKAVKADPEIGAFWRLAGLSNGILARYPEALTAMERSLQLEPKQMSLWSNLVRVNQILGHRHAAREAYQKQRELDPQAAEETHRLYILPFEGGTP